MATQAKTRKSADSGVQALADRIVEAARGAGNSYLDTTEATAKRVAELQKSVGEATRVELISTVADAQANLTRDVTDAYVSAGRKLIG
jgi:hypothetical protein